MNDINILNMKWIKDIINNSLYILMNLNLDLNEIYLVLITLNDLYKIWYYNKY